MNNNKHLTMEYNEEEVVKYIRNYVPQELKEKLSDDDINLVIDLIYEFYEEKGYMDESISEDLVVDIEEEEMASYVFHAFSKENIDNFTTEEISFIIKGELAYCESIGFFE